MIVAEPTDSPVASPVLLMVAIPLLDEDQVAEAVTSTIEPSEYVASAVYCAVKPAATDELAGLTSIDSITAGVIVI